ncbi:hypothetical protein JB92DRAFT_2677545, partial [Gautieria morchelliformis]
LQQEITKEKLSSSLDEETLALAHTMQHDMAVMVRCFLDIETTTSSLHSQLTEETEAIVDAYKEGSSWSQTLPSAESKRFIEHAYKFFVSHIFNPYPTREEKQAIADETNNSRVTRSTVSNWFANARRRCGWIDILKQRCNGNRDQMVDLAK